jgi:DNA-binding NtrC family response regulator
MPVIIKGATGIGKELVARAIHEIGPRSHGQFYSLHCGSLPSELFESELFGHESGAFTGAEESRTGLLRHLEGGTLFLDQITHLALDTQTKLLQAIDKGFVRPLGSLKTHNIDVRFIASSSEDLHEAVLAGHFREDLYYRLRGVEVDLPALRDRRSDVPALVSHFCLLHGDRLGRIPPSFSTAALKRLDSHDWPGNVRELESLIVRVLVSVTPGSVVGPERVLGLLGASEKTQRSPIPEEFFAGKGLAQVKDDVEREYLIRLFREKRGRIKEMTESLGIQRAYLYKRFWSLGINVQKLREELG